MAQVGKWLRDNKGLWIPLAVITGVAVTLLQGLAVFEFWGCDGSFLSFTGVKCIVIPTGVELALFVATVRSFDELHSRSVSNPHSLLGQALRNDAGRPAAPPPTREAWKGGFEDMDDASDKMSKGR